MNAEDSHDATAIVQADRAGETPGAAPGPIVRVADLRVSAGEKALVSGVDFTVAAGKVLAIVGASGSGKTTIGSALLGALRPAVTATGTVEVAGVDVLHCTPGEVPAAYLPQHPAAVLNPVRRIGGVLADIANARRPIGGSQKLPNTARHSGLPGIPNAGRHGDSLPPDTANPAQRTSNRALARAASRERIADAMRRVGLADPTFLRRFPHQLSGGQQQRLVLAQAFLCEAKLLVADEPTTGQDAVHRDQVAAELRLAAANGMTVVLLSHDLDLVESISDEVAVLESGAIVEHRPTAELFAAPRHDYTRRLLAARSVQRRAPKPSARTDAKIIGRGLTVEVGRSRTRILDVVDFEARQGECLAILGASGSGKTTLARTVAGLRQATAGDLHLDGAVLPVRGRRRTRAERAKIQYVFQDAHASFDEHRSIADQVARSAIRLRGLTVAAAREEAARVLGEVGLPPQSAERRRDKLSGGQLQRAALARALAAEPEVLVCDEITSGLDAITQGGILDLLEALKGEGAMTILLIAHEQAVADRLADKVMQIEHGRVAGSTRPSS